MDLDPRFALDDLVYGFKSQLQRRMKTDQTDGFSDASLDSGVNIDQELSLLGQNQELVLSRHSPDASDQSDDPSRYISTESEDEYGSSDFSDQDDFNDHFVSYRFEDYPESVFCDFEPEDEPTIVVEGNRRRSSVLNPSEIYVEKACDCEHKDAVIRRSNSIKSRL